MSKTTIPKGGITADAIDATLVADDAISEEHLASSAVTTAKINADAINATKIADDSISDEHLDITAITGQTAITSLADTDKFLVSDASDSGNLKYVEKQYLGGYAGVGEIKAWVNFNGTGTPSIRANGNVSSITDNGTGDNTVNFTSNISDGDYAVSGTANRNDGSNKDLFLSSASTNVGNVTVFGNDQGGNLRDMTEVSVVIVR